jgi:hypothetical protein
LAACFTHEEVVVLRDQERRQLRAYMVPSGIQIQTNGDRAPNGDLLWSVTARIKNSGQTPGINVRTVSEFAVMPRGVDSIDLSPLNKAFGTAETTVGAGQETGGPFATVSAGAFTDQVRNNLRVMIAGNATYQDVFGAEHKIKYCAFIGFPTGTDPNVYSRTRHPKGSVSFCPIGNCTDEECDNQPVKAQLPELGPVLPKPVESRETPQTTQDCSPDSTTEDHSLAPPP